MNPTDRIFQAFMVAYADANRTRNTPQATLRDVLTCLRQFAETEGLDYVAADEATSAPMQEAHPVSFDTTDKLPRCDGEKGCSKPVTHIDKKGYVYCTTHGLWRRESQPCRKLRPAELKKLSRGETVNRY